MRCHTWRLALALFAGIGGFELAHALADEAQGAGAPTSEARLPSTAATPVHYDSVSLRDSEIEARLTALESTVMADDKKDAKKDDPKTEPEDYEVGSDLGMTATWKDGLELSTKNKDFRIHIGGRTQFDVGFLDADPNVQNNINIPYQDGADFRRARFRIDGTMYEVVEFACEYDFINAFRVPGENVDRAVTAPTDLWLQFKELPIIGNMRIGNQKPAIGFEHLVSSRFLPFMERSYNQDTFYGGLFNGFYPGVSIFDTYGADDNGVWNLGVFKPTNNAFAFNANDDDYYIVGRLTNALIYENEGQQVLHIGGSVTQASTVGDRAIFRTRDAIRTGIASDWPVPASTGTFSADYEQQYNAELAGVLGPWTLQAEYLVNNVHGAAPIVNNVVQPGVGSLVYHGGYVQLMYFLTGEHDHYNKKTGVFERVRPIENFFVVRDPSCCPLIGRGAWQVGARYNYLDLNDGIINGGILHNGTAGLNWFLNPNAKIQFNAILTHRDSPAANGAGDGFVYGWGTRLAFDF